MISGRDALSSIDRAISEIRKDQEKASARVREATDAIARLQTQEATRFAALAELRLDSIRRGEIEQRLSAAEARAAKLIAEHAGELDRIERDIAEGEAERKRLVKMRDAAARQAEEAEQAYDEALAAFQEEFRKTAPFAEAIKAAQEAEHTFQEADRKAELAASDRDEKGKPYEDDPLFMYLWERKFGTSAYEGSGLARLLDRWVARLIGYVDAAANYRMLLEIPKRLREHAAALSAELEQRRAALQTLEEEARAAHPAGRLEAGLEEIERKVADLDEKIAHESARRNALEKQRAQLAGGNDSEYRKAIELLAFELSRQDMRSLKREAELTATGHDDELVRAIDDIREEIAELEEDVERDRDAVSSLDRRRSELEAVRGRYVSRRYDDATSYFDNDSLLKDLLAGVLGGVLSGGGMWRQIEREHRRRSRSDMDFGWRGFPTPGTGRSLPRGRSGGSIFGGGSIFTGGGRSTRPSRPPRRSGGGGGFRTGGGF